MLRRVLFAIVGCLVVGSALAQPSHKVVIPPANRGDTQRQPAGNEHNASPTQSVVVRAVDTAHTKGNAGNAPAPDKEKHELDRRLVLFTGLLVAVGFLQFLAIAVQAIFLWLAFRESQKASISATKSADAADRTAHALMAAQRAYVVVRDFVPLDSNSDPPGLHVIVIWMNTGTTPTRTMRTWISWQARTDALPGDFDFPDINSEGRKPDEAFLGPKSEMNALTLFISRDQMIEMREGRRRVYIWGWAEYSDIFPGTPLHRTEFCNEIVAVPAPGNPNALILQFRIHPGHNSAT